MYRVSIFPNIDTLFYTSNVRCKVFVRMIVSLHYQSDFWKNNPRGIPRNLPKKVHPQLGGFFITKI